MSTARNADTRRLVKPLMHMTGLALVMAWTYVAFFSRLVHYSERNATLSHLNTTYAWASLGTIVALIGCALMCRALVEALSRRSGKSPELVSNKVVYVMSLGASIAIAACTVMLVLVEKKVFLQPWCSIAAFISGFASGVMFLGWAPTFFKFERVKSLLLLVGSFVFAAVLFVAIQYFHKPVALLVTTLLPLASFTLYHFASRDSSPQNVSRAKDSSQLNGVFIRVIVAVFALGFAESLIRSLFLIVDPITNTVAYRWLFMTATVISALIIASSNIFKASYDSVANLNRIAMISFCVLALLSPIISGIGLLADLPPLICYCMFYMLVWVYLSQTARAYRITPRTVFGFGLGFAYAGCLLGTFFGGALTSFYELSYRAQSLIALLCAGTMLIAFLFIADNRTLALLIDAEDDRPQTPRRFRLRVEEVAQTYGLTAKETEVLMLAAKGRTTQRIKEELGISTGTANTHLMHIYKKLDVHDRQQLLDMLDGREEE